MQSYGICALILILINSEFSSEKLKVGMGRIHYPADYPDGYPAGYPVAGYPVSGGKIGRIAGYHFSIISY